MSALDRSSEYLKNGVYDFSVWTDDECRLVDAYLVAENGGHPSEIEGDEGKSWFEFAANLGGALEDSLVEHPGETLQGSKYGWTAEQLTAATSARRQYLMTLDKLPDDASDMMKGAYNSLGETLTKNMDADYEWLDQHAYASQETLGQMTEDELLDEYIWGVMTMEGYNAKSFAYNYKYGPLPESGSSTLPEVTKNLLEISGLSQFNSMQHYNGLQPRLTPEMEEVVKRVEARKALQAMPETAKEYKNSVGKLLLDKYGWTEDQLVSKASNRMRAMTDGRLSEDDTSVASVIYETNNPARKRDRERAAHEAKYPLLDFDTFTKKSDAELAALSKEDLLKEFALADTRNMMLGYSGKYEYLTRVESACSGKGITTDEMKEAAQGYRRTYGEHRLAEKYGEGEWNIPYLAEYNGTTEDNIYKYLAMSDVQKETTIGLKTNLTSDIYAVTTEEKLNAGYVFNEGKITECRISPTDGGKYHVESDYLGTFDYNPDEFQMCYRTTESGEKIPFLWCVAGLSKWDDSQRVTRGWPHADDPKVRNREDAMRYDAYHHENWTHTRSLAVFGGEPSGYDSPNEYNGAFLKISTQEIAIPDGIRNIDYMFDGKDHLNFIPRLPDSVESAHCTFRNCTWMYEESHDALDRVAFGYDTSPMHWPPHLRDMSGTFYGCERLANVSFAALPTELETINDAFYDCPVVCDADVESSDRKFAHMVTNIAGGTQLMNTVTWDHNLYLTPEFSVPANAGSSDAIKDITKEQNARNERFRMNYKEQIAEDPDFALEHAEETEHLQEVEGKSAVVRTEKIVDGDVLVRGVGDEEAAHYPKRNEVWALIQTLAVDAGLFAVGKGITTSITGKKWAGWAVGLGAGVLGHMSGLSGKLACSIEPALRWVNDNVFKEGSFHDGFDKFLDKLHMPTQEDFDKADMARFENYMPTALKQSVYTPAQTANVLYDSSSVQHSMYINGAAVAEGCVLERVGATGDPATAQSIADSLGLATKQAEDEVWAEWNANPPEGIDVNEEMRRYYGQLFEGLKGYNEGALNGIVATYDNDSSNDTWVDKDNYWLKESKGLDAAGKAAGQANSLVGLSYVNQMYVNTTMDSLMRMNNQYHFMRQEDWDYLDSLDIPGVGKLSEWTPAATYEIDPMILIGYVPEAIDFNQRLSEREYDGAGAVASKNDIHGTGGSLWWKSDYEATRSGGSKVLTDPAASSPAPDTHATAEQEDAPAVQTQVQKPNDKTSGSSHRRDGIDTSGIQEHAAGFEQLEK